MKSRKGFTLIELLVVIAIIGILAAIVLVSLRGAPTRAKNTAIKNDLGQVRTQAELIFIDNNSYEGVCSSDTALGSSTELTVLQNDLTDQGTTIACHDDVDSWCVSAQLLPTTGSDTFCVDSNGIAKVYDTGDDCDGTTLACE